MHLSLVRSFINLLTVIWLATFAAAQAQITPFTTQPPRLNRKPRRLRTGDSWFAVDTPGVATAGVAPTTPGSQTSVEVRPTYELGPSDQIMIHAPDAEELNDKTFRIEDDGTATLPLVGIVKMG